MKKTFNKIINLLLAFVIATSVVGCDSTADARLYFELNEKPKTLDPQLASGDSEMLIVRNIFEGLLRKDESGKIVPGAAQSYEKAGLTYTFNIREDATWSDGRPLIADDFVFGITRALLPDTDAPFAKRLYSIRGAEQVHNGSADDTFLSIKSSGDHKLAITLLEEDPDFLDTLTTSVAMPCSRDFFYECKGKYGLGSEYILSNGSYSITKWNKDEFGIRIYKNEEYKGDFKAKNYGVLIACRDDKTPLELLIDNSTDMAFLTNGAVKEARQNEVNIKSYQNICWVMSINKRYSADYRSAFSKLVAPTIYSDELPEGFSPATSVYPGVLEVLDGETIFSLKYDREGARSIFSSAVASSEDKSFPLATLHYFDNPEIKPAVTAQVGHFQQTLSAAINISAEQNLSAADVFSDDNPFDFAVFPITAKSGSVLEYLDNFKTTASGKTPSEAETELLSDNTLIPFAYENTNIAYTKALENVFTEPQNGYVDFSFIIKHE